MAGKAKSIYVCSECGYESVKWYGKCPQCNEWNTMEETAPIAASKATSSRKAASVQSVKKLSEISSDIEKRISTGIKEFTYCC